MQQLNNDGERIAAALAMMESHIAEDRREFARFDAAMGDMRIDLNALNEKFGDIQKSVWQASGAVGAFSFVASIVIALAIKHFA